MLEQIRTRIPFFTAILFALLPIIPQKVKSIPIIALGVFSLLIFFAKPRINKSFVPNVLLGGALYMVLLLTFWYSANTARYSFFMERQMTLIFTPLAFFLSGGVFTQKAPMRLFAKVFIFSNLIFLLLFLWWLDIDLEQFNTRVGVDKVRRQLQTLPYIATHPNFVCLYSGVATFFALDEFRRSKSWFYLLPAGIFILTIFVIVSKMAIIALIASGLLVFCVHRIFSVKTKVFGILATLLCTVVLIFSVPRFKIRFVELIDATNYEINDRPNSTSIRYIIETCSWSAIKAHPWMGYGAGDVQDVLNACYSEKNTKLMNSHSHNQYFSYWLRAGILGLLSFVLFLASAAYQAWRGRNYLFVAIIAYYALNLITDNLLEKANGVILYAFLLNYILFSQALISDSDKPESEFEINS